MMTINLWIVVMFFTWTYSNPCRCNPLVLEISFFRPDAEVMLWAIKMFLHSFNLDWTILKKDSFGVFIHVSYTRFFSYALSGTYWKQKIRMNHELFFPSFMRHQSSTIRRAARFPLTFSAALHRSKETNSDRPVSREKSPFFARCFFLVALNKMCTNFWWWFMKLDKEGLWYTGILKKHNIC